MEKQVDMVTLLYDLPFFIKKELERSIKFGIPPIIGVALAIKLIKKGINVKNGR